MSFFCGSEGMANATSIVFRGWGPATPKRRWVSSTTLTDSITTLAADSPSPAAMARLNAPKLLQEVNWEAWSTCKRKTPWNLFAGCVVVVVVVITPGPPGHGVADWGAYTPAAIFCTSTPALKACSRGLSSIINSPHGEKIVLVSKPPILIVSLGLNTW